MQFPSLFLLFTIIIVIYSQGQCYSPSFSINCPGYFSVQGCGDISMSNNCIQRDNGDPICLCPLGYICSGTSCQYCNINGYIAIDPNVGDSCVETTSTTTYPSITSSSLSSLATTSTTGIILQSSSTLSNKSIGIIVGIVAGIPILIAISFMVRWKCVDRNGEKKPLL